MKVLQVKTNSLNRVDRSGITQSIQIIEDKKNFQGDLTFELFR